MSRFMCQKMFRLASALKSPTMINRPGPSLVTRSISGSPSRNMEFLNDEPNPSNMDDQICFNQVIVLGAVCSEPYALQRMGEVFGYSINLRTTNNFQSKGARVSAKTYHDVVCFRRDLIPLCQSLRVGDRVFVQGHLVNRFQNNMDDRSEGERKKMEIKANVMEKLA